MERDEHLLRIFGERVRFLREQKDWSQVDLAYEAGIDPRTVSRIETGKQDTRLSIIVALALALECKIDELIVIEK